MKICITSMHKGAMNTNKKEVVINAAETEAIAKLLRNQGHEVTIATTRDTNIGVDYKKLEVNSFDRVLIMNSTIDFPGGEENKPIEMLFEFLKKYKGPLYYILVDLAIPFKQLYPLVKKREWCKYKSADEINLSNDFIIISQSHNFNEVMKIHEKSGINIKDIKFVPINEWILHTNDFVPNTGEVDLILGTSSRGGRRREKYTDYFFGRKNITTEFYGLIKPKDFSTYTLNNLSNPKFSPKVDARQVINKNSTGFATVIVGDKNYNNNMKTLRISESLLANCVTFIDEDFDREHAIYGDYNFMYVNSGDELEKKILILKNRKDIYEKVLFLQHKLVEKWRCNNLPKLLSEALK